MRAVTDPETRLPIGPEVTATPARRPAPNIRLEGRTVLLERLDPDKHAAALFRAVEAGDPAQLYLYLSPPPPTDFAGFRSLMAAMAAAEDPFALAVVDRETGEAVGHATFMRIEPTHRVIEVGNILYTPALQRSVAATEAMYLMARHAFEELGYRRYEWKCNALNAPSRRAAARYGFTYEGTFRSHMIVKGRSRDTAWFSITEEEWPARRRAFERWLDPANFDSGEQRVSLSTINSPTLRAGDAVLRRAGRDDVEAFDAVHRAAFAQNREILGREPLPLLIGPDEVLSRYETWLLEDERGLAGTLALEPRADDLEIWSVAVEPSRQDTGIGRKLLSAAEARAKALGLGTLRLYTGAALTKNVDWYGRRGYAVERTEELPDGRQVVHMVKHIEP
ncbi:GNAT family N-acetyltransferase [Enterovirga aerilata]|uniref:N-acetyltransferase n=1 Tax=Enterovirga aerilata TaxID=2730920 RepID=A0A849I5T0_9HYPH|nr:GNAT family N-acetyltransferase [Enterovirga sp. DB1703]NNM71397.1 N-acetyltransferase [Enterovirga sp. DB1703]